MKSEVVFTVRVRLTIRRLQLVDRMRAENLNARLLVEDDPTTSKSIELMLTHANLNVYATDLGEEGIDLAKLYDYDLILLELTCQP